MLRKEVVVKVGTEVIRSGASAAERITIGDLLNVSEAASDAAIAIGVESIEVDRDAGVTTGIHFCTIQDRLNCTVNDLRSGGAVGVYKEAVFVSLIIALGIAIAERKFESGLVRNLAAELGSAFFDSCIHGSVDGVDGLGIGLGNDQRNAVLGGAAVDGSCLPDVGIGKTDNKK